MSLDNIQLPPFLHQALYKNNLVQIHSNKANSIAKKKVTIDFLGRNEKKIIFLAKDNQSKYLSDVLMKFLNDLLVACGLNMNDIAFINFTQNSSASYQVLEEELFAENILLFGVSANDLDLPFAIPFFQIQKFNNQQYLLVPPLEEIQLNVELKKQLWINLQKIFNLKK